MRARLVALAVGFVTGTSALAQVGPMDVPPLAPVSGLDLTHDLQQHITRATLGTWWGGILVMKGGETLIRYTNGLAQEDGTAFTEHTLFDVGDLSMQFTAVALLRLEQQGKISLDDPVSKFYPSTPAETAKTTIRQLMSHTSGLSDKAPVGQVDLYERDSTAMAVLSTQLGPVGQWNYSRRGYNVLAAIIERASGRTFDDYMRQEVFGAAGMKESGFTDGKGLDELPTAVRVSSGRAGDAGRLLLFSGWHWGSRGTAGIVTNLVDMERWERALRTDVLISQAQREKLNSMVVLTYGLGSYITTTQRNTRRVWVGGLSPGFIAVSFRYVDEDATVFTVSNEKGDADLMAFALSDILFPPMPEQFGGELIFPPNVFNSEPLESQGLEWKVARTGDDLHLSVLSGASKAEFAHISMNEGKARSLLAVLGEMVRFPSIDPGVQGSTVTLDARYLGISDKGRSQFSDQARLEIRSLLEGTDAQGNRTYEKRPVLAVIDPKAKGWPLVVRMDAAGAESLYKGLSEAVKPSDGENRR